MATEYILTEVKFKQLVSRFGILSCAKCGKPLKPKDRIISIDKTCKSKRYHKECHEEMFINV